MRKISEVVEDIKNKLNEIDNKETCDSEDIYDIDKLVDEIAQIDFQKTSWLDKELRKIEELLEE